MKTYIAGQGDTLRKIAYFHEISPYSLLKVNPWFTSLQDYVQPNTHVWIPTEKEPETAKEKPGSCLYEFGPKDLAMKLSMLQALYPSRLSVKTIGESVCHQPIYHMKIGKGNKHIFYSGGWHANEWMTSKFLVDWVEEVLRALYSENLLYDYNLSQIFESITLHVVPMVNPDGIELVHQGVYDGHPFAQTVRHINRSVERFDHWSANIRGVDLNHQWPAGWEEENLLSPQKPWPRHFGGPHPLSEPEVKAIYQLTNTYPFQHVLTFHSQGQLIYWGYRHKEPKESEEMARKLAVKSSYTPVHTAESDAGYKDWFIQDFKRPGFTIEIGVGQNPLPLSAYEEIWVNNVELALEGLVL
ncbi:M14 family metallopeptidase [Texcoconibacillus texcoconensis]|uniref:G-D-glutamyl-meso-diaminopimelate peptidase n=1 Tax=Texcoconibacillus texcoconensis TaxID=1095777 RepID=A0A840QNL4_9BACI|nr:M14 family metallocarboxypeptidase [Texcoconibacillus texcoconensis]MBB5172937.1 g-D-glutamyl-meso-diaminopimelate peptidase [Texcoconibacillus texcoconensis]